VAKKSKAGAAAPGNIGKARTRGRSTSAKARKSSSKRSAVEKVEMEPAPTFDPTNDQIQIRAYFISERRRRLALPGDANSDWLEAKRQLLAEVKH
jgi:hypothetical protein